MSDYEVIRAALKATIEGLAQPGVVHDRPRYVADAKEYLTKFVSDLNGSRETRGWWVAREGRTDSYSAFQQVNMAHTWVVRGVQGFRDSDDTDALFGALVDEVMAAMSGLTITGTDDAVWEVNPPVLRVSEIRQFGSVGCHYAEIVVIVQQDATL